MSRLRDREPGDEPAGQVSGSCWICEQCGDKTSGCMPTLWGRLCPKCNFRHIRATASQPTDLCVEAGCSKTVAQHIAESRELVRMIEARAVKL